MKEKRMRNRAALLLALSTLSLPGLAGAAGVELISRAPLRAAPDTTGGFLGLQPPAISADGRYVAFSSLATNQIPGQAEGNIGLDVFFHDRAAGTTRLVSHVSGAPATTGDGPSFEPVLSADGRFVAYVSTARNIVAGAGGASPDPVTGNIYLWDRETGQNILVSRAEGGDRASLSPSLSADGGVLVFSSRAINLVPGLILAPATEQVYAYERATGTLSLVSRAASSSTRSGNGSSSAPIVSADGRFVAYLSGATDLVAGQNDTNGTVQDVFLFDRLTGATTLVSHAGGSALTTPNGSSHSVSLSADGRYVAFVSFGTNLVPGVADTNGEIDAFLYDRLLGTVTFVSLAATGAAEGGYAPEISQDGGTVAYFIDSPGSPRGGQIVAYDVPSGSRSLVTRTPESPFTHADKGASSLSLSADGRIVAFTSGATNLVTGQEDANNGGADLFVHDRASGVTVLASHTAGSPERTGDQDSFAPALSADGIWVAYGSNASDLVAGVRDAGLTPDLFLYERAANANRAVSLHPPGEASRTTAGHSGSPSVSADGRYVAFASSAALIPGLVVPPGRSNIYLHDRVTRRTVLVSRSTRPGLAGGDFHSLAPRVSRDGGAVAFISQAGDLAPGQQDRGGTFDVFLWDRRTGRTTLVSHAHGFPNRAGTGESFLQDLSADGNLVVFSSTAPGLARRQRDGNETSDIFVWDRRTGVTTLVSHSAGNPSRAGNAGSLFASMSPGGGFIAFSSAASDLTAGDRNRRNDAFVYERRTGTVSRLSGASGALSGAVPLISANGRWAAFISGEDQEVLDQRVVLVDRATGGTLEIVPSNHGLVSLLGLSDDGRWVLFVSNAPDLVPGQRDGELAEDLFLFDRVTRRIRLVSHVPGDPLRASGRGAFRGRLSADGRWVAFESESLLPTDPRGINNIFLYDRTTEEVTLASPSLFDPPQGGNSRSFDPVVTNGGLVAFASQATDLVPRDFNFIDTDVFVYVP